MMEVIKEPELGWAEALGEESANPPQGRSSGNVIVTPERGWKVAPVETRICAQFEEWVQVGALRAIAQAGQMTGSEEASKLRSAYVGDYGAGSYAWDGRFCRAAREDVPGLQHLLFLLLRRCRGQEDVTKDDVKQLFEEDPRQCEAAIGWALGNAVGAKKPRETEQRAEEKNGAGPEKRKGSEIEPATLDR